MIKYKRLRRGRDIAPFGAIASLVGAGIQAYGQYKSDQEQAKAQELQAKQQAEQIQSINDNNTKLQQEYIEFTKAENEKNRQLQQSIQLNNQMQMGAENETNRLLGARIQLKKGGSARRKLREGNDTSSLQGRSNNLPFQVIDGGGVVYLGTTPSGNDLYELYGNDHKHYHKTKEGKYKSGVGIKFANNQIIEGEGNQNGNQGELMLVGPTDARFISKHSLRGFNPAKAVDQGMTPEEAYIQQERIKSIYNIGDKDNTSSPVKRNKARYGYDPVTEGYNGGIVEVEDIVPINNSKSIITSKPYVYEPVYQWSRREPLTIPDKILSTELVLNTLPDAKDTFKSTNSNTSTKKSTWDKYGGAIIGGIGDLGAAGINALGNSLARIQIQKGNTAAANTLAEAYRNLKTIDPSIIDADSYKAPHAMATIRSANVNVNPELALIERANQRKLSSIRDNSISGAAALNRINKANIDSYDMRSRVYSNANKQAEAIHQENANRLTQVAISNADRDAQARANLAQARLSLAQYNNDIANERITGAAQAYADRDVANASAYANSLQANHQGFANAFNSIGKNIYDTKNTLDKRQFDFNSLMLGASDDNLYNYAITRNDEFAKQIRSMLINKYKNSKDEKYINWYNNLINIK